MDIVFSRCAGLDVHKDTIAVCVRRLPSGAKRKTESQVRTFRTVTEQILALADWLAEEGVTHVAMESTGVYWKPIWNLLEGGPFELVLVNAQHIKQVPAGRRMSRIASGSRNSCSTVCCAAASCRRRRNVRCVS